MPLEETPDDAKRKSLLSELARGAKETFKNAEQLFLEASLLKDNGMLNRALFLHQISMEECAKVELLGVSATSLLMGEEVDATKLAAALASHKAKNRTNAYMLEPTEEELAARKRADWKGLKEAFSKHQDEFHLQSNTAKNASLYVDFRDGKFVTPSERITVEMVSKIAATNESFLGYMYPKLDMLLKWKNDIDGIGVTLIQFKSRVEQLKSELPDDPEKAMEILMQAMLEGARGKRKGGASEDAG